MYTEKNFGKACVTAHPNPATPTPQPASVPSAPTLVYASSLSERSVSAPSTHHPPIPRRRRRGRGRRRRRGGVPPRLRPGGVRARVRPAGEAAGRGGHDRRVPEDHRGEGGEGVGGAEGRSARRGRGEATGREATTGQRKSGGISGGRGVGTGWVNRTAAKGGGRAGMHWQEGTGRRFGTCTAPRRRRPRPACSQVTAPFPQGPSLLPARRTVPFSTLPPCRLPPSSVHPRPVAPVSLLNPFL